MTTQVSPLGQIRFGPLNTLVDVIKTLRFLQQQLNQLGPLLQQTLNNGTPTFTGPQSTGAGAALLGANSPSTHLAAPYEWITVLASDGTPCTMPIWKL